MSSQIYGCDEQSTCYDGNGGCSNLYCHGTGKQLASYVQNNIAPSCTTCHPTNSLSGRHQFHLNNGIRCDECHVNVVRINTMIAPQLHVNGSIDVQFSTIDMNRLDNRCLGSCHGETHRQESW
jgi:predicted CxxxxCH...CXXCH cytochrome family protein